MISSDLFGGFDPALLAQIQAGNARQDLTEIAAWLDAGRIDHFALYAGEIFRNQYGDEYEMVLRMREQYGVHFVMAKNHSKVTLCANHAEGYYVVVESSANVNTNPRIEQACVTRSRELFDFYREFFDGLQSIDKDTRAGAGANVIPFPPQAAAPEEGD